MRNIVEMAAEIAAKAHAGQTRKDGTTPYIVHPMRVAARLENYTEAVRAVAWLHDVLEDTPMTATGLAEAGMTREVIFAVASLTKLKDETQAEYLQRVKANKIARIVKQADMLDNLTDNPSPKQIAKYATGLLILLGVYPKFGPDIRGEPQDIPTCPGLWKRGESLAYLVREEHGRLEITFREGNVWRVDGLPAGMRENWVRVGNLPT